MEFTEAMENVARIFEALGAAVLLGGLFLSIGLACRSYLSSRDGHAAYGVLRESFGGAILLGLEILVAADLVSTVAVAPTLENLAGLGLLVLIRTFLSFSLEVELEGMLPWHRAFASGAGHVAQAARRSGESSSHSDPVS